MLDLYSVPIDAIAWCIGAVALWIFAFKSFLNYRSTKNPLIPMYIGISFWLGLACFFFGAPLLITHNTSTLFYTNYIGDICVQINMLFQAWLAWFMGWRKYTSLYTVLIPTALFSMIILTIEYHTSRVVFSSSPYLLIYKDSSWVLWLKSLLYLCISWPVGYFFIKQGLAQPGLRARVKSIATGLMFILISGVAIVSNLLNHGGETFNGAVQNFIIFSLFLIIVLWPRKTKMPQKSSPSRP